MKKHLIWLIPVGLLALIITFAALEDSNREQSTELFCPGCAEKAERIRQHGIARGGDLPLFGTEIWIPEEKEEAKGGLSKKSTQRFDQHRTDDCDNTYDMRRNRCTDALR